ncbi:uncharacterized protein LOC141728039 [Zonotrichia albicollis]|uniref:uncharacterized protein LOC141728039 n=1 Tax=Zonotrichia albicollis TaxID=44394 RepID=UPI003D80C15E
MEALFDDCSVDVGPLLVQWKKCEELWRGSGSCTPQSSQGSPSISDVDEEEIELLCDVESPSPPHDGCCGDDLLSELRRVHHVPPNAVGVGSPAPESGSSAGGANSPFSGSVQPAGHAQSVEAIGGGTLPASGSAQPAGHAQPVEAAGGGASVGTPTGPAPVGGQPVPLRSVGAVPAAGPCDLGRALIGGVPGSLVPPRSDAAPRAVPPSASQPAPLSGDGGLAPVSSLAAPVSSGAVSDLRAVPAAAAAEVTHGGAAAQQGTGVFTFSATADTAGGRPVGARGHGAFLSGLWTLPACQVTVRPRYPERFWPEAKTKTDEINEHLSSRHLQGRGADSFGSAGAAGGAGTSGVAPAPGSPLTQGSSHQRPCLDLIPNTGATAAMGEVRKAGSEMPL